VGRLDARHRLRRLRLRAVRLRPGRHPLPRTTNQQVLVGSPVAFAELVPGDLVFFRDRSGDIYHVGMYASDGRFLHAPFTGDVVKYDSFSTPYYGQRFATGRRVAD
jgi:cell wall-associated NlpC family hydrolase